MKLKGGRLAGQRMCVRGNRGNGGRGGEGRQRDVREEGNMAERKAAECHGGWLACLASEP